MKKPLFISWIGFQRRVASIDQILGFDVLYVPPPFQAKWLKPLGYLAQTLRTAGALLVRRPAVIWTQSPPSFLPHLLLALRPIAGRYKIVVDCHQSVFEPPWTQVPGATAAMNRCDLVLVHNAETRSLAEGIGVAPERIMILEDPPSELAAPEPGRAEDPNAPPYVMVPCSFAPDEPIPALIEAARLAPEIRFLITGSRRKAEGLGYLRDAPENVRFTDYLPVPEFERLFVNASVVLGLTKFEGIQLSVANEALGANRALVLSDTRILRAMFGEAALFAETRPEAIAERLREALAQRPELERRSAALKTRRQQDWRAAAAAVNARLA